MELNINSPAYYTNNYGIDDEIYRMCNEIYLFMKSRNYSDIVTMIGIIPVVAPKELTDNSSWEESIKVKKSIGLVIVYKHIDYDKYKNGTIEQRKKLTIKCILEAILMIKKKPGTKFNAKQFEIDLLNFVGYNKEELENI